MKNTNVVLPSTSLMPTKQRVFSGDNLLQIAMPMGGIGAGSICLNGYGGLQDFAIRNGPAISAMPDSFKIQDSAFAVLHIKGKQPVTKLVEGPLPPEKVYNLGLKGQGLRDGGYEGLPRFRKCSFKGEYPFGFVSLSDPAVPLSVEITGFSPLIPLDDINSGIPCLILEYTLTNKSRSSVGFEFSFHMSDQISNHFEQLKNSHSVTNTIIPGAGVFFQNRIDPNSTAFGSSALLSLDHKPSIKCSWLRSGWFDWISVLWDELSSGSFQPNNHSTPKSRHHNGGSILFAGSLRPGRSITYPVAVAWYFPNNADPWWPPKGECDCDDKGKCKPPRWKPYYTTKWSDAQSVALYVRDNYKSLRGRTAEFHGALFSSSMPDFALDAISANLAILKSPTLLRQNNGNIWGWEGCFCTGGCCPGSCTHVWNYAQTIPHLFPHLERTLRELELVKSMDDKGHINFRAALPDNVPPSHDFHAASDGQFGGILKLYRDWHISGDKAWLARMYPLAKKSIEFGISSWDPKEQGVLIEPHHNTYDIEFWGPEGMCSGVYIAALSAMALLAKDAGKPQDAPRYESLARRGAAYLDEHLFNGEYYCQKVTWKGLRNSHLFEKRLAEVKAEGNVELLALLTKYGPAYQFGDGCLADGVIGAWMADIYGVPTPQTRKNILHSLRSIFKYNFKPSLLDVACTHRPGYAIGDEGALLICTWPRGGRMPLRMPYSDEAFTGIEYQAASHMIMSGMPDEGLKIVKAVRDRFDGRTRNPWNEYECGNYYARAMASYALLQAISGFRYSAVSKTLWFGPKLKTAPGKPFKTFFSTASGYGTIELARAGLKINMLEGKLEVEHLELDLQGKRIKIACHALAERDKPATIKIKV